MNLFNSVIDVDNEFTELLGDGNDGGDDGDDGDDDDDDDEDDDVEIIKLRL